MDTAGSKAAVAVDTARSKAAAAVDINNERIVELIEKTNAENILTKEGVSTRGKKRSKEVSEGEKFTCADGEYCLTPQDEPVLGKHKCATCQKTLHEDCGVLVEGSTSFLERKECHSCNNQKEVEPPKQKKQRKKKEVVGNEEVEKTICKDVKEHLHVFTEGLSAEKKLEEICNNKNSNGRSKLRYEVAFYVDEESCIGALTYHDIYKYKNNLYTGDEVVSGFYYLLDSKFGGGENKFFGTGFFTTCVQDFSIERKLTQFKKKFRTEWKKLFFPVNAHSNHWILLTADVDEKTVKVYDSLGKSNETYTHLLLNIINQVKKKDEQWVVVDNTTANIQRQMDLVNCGWFTCWYAYQIATNKSVAKWLGCDYDKEIRAIKKNIMLSLVDKKIFSKGGK